MIYGAATAHTCTPGVDGTTEKSASFPIQRGVLQEDITSPLLYFILALDLLLRTHDECADKGVSMMDTIIHTLGYVYDVALIDDGDAAGINRASTRVTKISKGSREDADMNIVM